jgi:hypothetical protein
MVDMVGIRLDRDRDSPLVLAFGKPGVLRNIEDEEAR